MAHQMSNQHQEGNFKTELAYKVGHVFFLQMYILLVILTTIGYGFFYSYEELKNEKGSF